MERRTRLSDGPRDFRTEARRNGGSFWISAANYYLLSVLVVAITFLVVLDGFYDIHDETSWIAAGLAGIGFAACLVLFREVILRRIRQRANAERRLSRHLRVSDAGTGEHPGRGKVSLEQNGKILDDIRTKSEAAKVLGGLADAHREVFELCERYISLVSGNLSEARPGSPRIPALRKGRRLASDRHRFHMLRWAEIKAKEFSAEPNGSDRPNRKSALAREALEAVGRAIEVYPDERALADSKAVLEIFLISAGIRDSIDRAERAASEGNGQIAIEHYREALAQLEGCELGSSERKAIEDRIRSEIGRINTSFDA